MFQVRVSIQGPDFESASKLIPDGWVPERTRSAGLIRIFDARILNVVGKIDIVKDGVVITVDEKKARGTRFWEDFGEKYPMFDPYSLKCCILSRKLKENHLFSITQISEDDFGDRSKMAAYPLVNYESFVAYYYWGDFNAGVEIKVNPYGRIQKDGSFILDCVRARTFKLNNEGVV